VSVRVSQRLRQRLSLRVIVFRDLSQR
jgi:hypothetical protein